MNSDDLTTKTLDTIKKLWTPKLWAPKALDTKALGTKTRVSTIYNVGVDSSEALWISRIIRLRDYNLRIYYRFGRQILDQAAQPPTKPRQLLRRIQLQGRIWDLADQPHCLTRLGACGLAPNWGWLQSGNLFPGNYKLWRLALDPANFSPGNLASWNLQSEKLYRVKIGSQATHLCFKKQNEDA